MFSLKDKIERCQDNISIKIPLTDKITLTTITIVF